MKLIAGIVGSSVLLVAFLHYNPTYLADSTATFLEHNEQARRSLSVPSAAQVCAFMERGFTDGISGTISAELNRNSAKSMSLMYEVTEEELITMYWRGVNYGKSTMAHHYDVTDRRSDLEQTCLVQATQALEQKAALITVR